MGTHDRRIDDHLIGVASNPSSKKEVLEIMVRFRVSLQSGLLSSLLRVVWWDDFSQPYEGVAKTDCLRYLVTL